MAKKTKETSTDEVKIQENTPETTSNEKKIKLHDISTIELISYLEAVDILYGYYDNNARCGLGDYTNSEFSIEFKNISKKLSAKYNRMKHSIYEELEKRMDNIDFN